MSVYRTIGPLVSRFGFEGWIWILIASVPGLCLFFYICERGKGCGKEKVCAGRGKRGRRTTSPHLRLEINFDEG